jgi:hypothetical protein
MVAVPEIGLFDESRPLHTTKVESQTPPQTFPEGEMVAIFVFDELKVNVAITGVPAEFTAEGETDTTCPATREMVEGLSVTEATVLLADEDPPPQPASKDKNSPITARDDAGPTPGRQRPPFGRDLRIS